MPGTAYIDWSPWHRPGATKILERQNTHLINDSKKFYDIFVLLSSSTFGSYWRKHAVISRLLAVGVEGAIAITVQI